MIRTTSKEAYEQERQKLNELAAQVLDAIETFYFAQDRWPTNREIQHLLNHQEATKGSGRVWTPADVSARRGDLLAVGIITSGDRTHCSITGKSVLTWRVKYINTKAAPSIIDKHGQAVMNF